MANPCEWNGTRYPSEAALARAAEMHVNTVRKHLNTWGHLDYLKIGRGNNHPSKRSPGHTEGAGGQA